MYRTTGTILCFDKYAIPGASRVYLSARVIKFEKTPEGEPLSADCVVYFSGNVVSTFHVAYSATPLDKLSRFRRTRTTPSCRIS
jgi:hypothetical protein